MEPSPDASKDKPRKRISHHSEWLEKALAEGGSRKRTSKKVSNPDFVDTDIALKTSFSDTKDRELEDQPRPGDFPLADLDYENMSNYEKFYKYKIEYKAYRAAKIANKKKLSIESPSMDTAVASPLEQDESNSSVSTKEHKDQTCVFGESHEQTENNTEQSAGISKKRLEILVDQAEVNKQTTSSVNYKEKEIVSDISHDPTEASNEKAENGNEQIASTSTTTPPKTLKVLRRGRKRLNRSRSSTRQSSGDESYSTSKNRSRQSDDTSATRRERSRRRQGPTDITPRQSPRVQKKLAEETTVSSILSTDHNEGEEAMNTDLDVENVPAHSVKPIIYLDKDKYCWFCHKEVTSRDSSNDAHRCHACYKIFHVKCVTEFDMKTECVVQGNEWECRSCVLYRQYKEKDQWAPYVEYLGHDKYKKQLRFIIEKLKKYPSAKELLRPVNTRLFPDYPLYIAHPIHFEKIDQRLNDGEYRCVDTLLEDIRWMVHNSVIFNGSSSGITKDLRSLLKNLRMELYDLDSCACCYIHAYTRPELWFVLPCPTPHLLVWAQLKGFPYWPAKVYDSSLEKRPGEILVKFFGDHARSWIPYDNIYLYSLDPPSECPSKKKKSRQHDMISSLMEMERHVEFLKKEFEVFRYPEQDILIGSNPEERALQLKYMIPMCGSKTTANKPTTSTPLIKPAPLEPTKLDMNDAKSKRNMLTLLEERLQQSRSDSEDSVKSFGKIGKEISKDKRVIKVAEYKEILRQQELTQTTTSKEITRSEIRIPSNTQRGVRCQHLFKMLEKKLRRADKKQMKRKRLLKATEKSENKNENRDENSENTTNKPSTSSSNVRITGDVQKSENGKGVNSIPSSWPVVAKVHLSSLVKKPQCGDIDSFIESHLARTLPTTDWDGDRIPPILTPREKRVTRGQLAIQNQEERKLESQASVEQQNEANQEHGKSEETPEESERQSKEGEGKHNKGNQKDCVDKLGVDQDDKENTKNYSKETTDANETKTKGVDENVEKKPTKELQKMSHLSSLRLHQRLFRHKKYSAQLFQFRKLQSTYPRTLRNKQEDSTIPSVLPDISKFFDVTKQDIKNPVVNLTSISVEEIKELKRKVKLSKTRMRSKLQGPLSSAEVESGIVPIEDTMRISTGSDDLCSMDSTIDMVASGVLSNEYWGINPGPASLSVQSKSITLTPTVSGTSSSSSRPGRAVPFAFPDDVDLKLRSNPSSHKQHVKSIVDYLKTSENDKNSYATMVNVNKLESMAGFLVELKNQNQISVDTQYNSALTSAELILYSEYATSYPLPELSSADYDEEFVLS
ncbi:hypothetical protein WDU94_004923 [Cyamophila willieti]